MKPAAFEYHRVFSAQEAVQLLSELGDEAKILAGGQSLAPMMNFRLARPSALIDINRVSDLDYIRRDGAALTIGALTRHRTVETSTSADILDGFAVLPKAAHHIGHFPIRTRGTVGGSIAHSDPSAEWCLLARLFDATIVTESPRGKREVGSAEWFTGFLTTSAEYDEVVVEIRFTNPRTYSALAEFAQRKGDFAIASAAVAFDVTDGGCANTTVVLGGVGSEPFRSPELDAVANGRPPGADTAQAVATAAQAMVNPPADLHGGSDYRRHLVGSMIRQAFADAGAVPTEAA
ncbi:carbon-monoxide dehydrogenase medium subunit [Antricoccus suffuscus]|uniref:Carbon-monoxide dehydrogenase medium subunit n=1 Tax=Antricoccus suffuscus TaxID=1629062 RepID=A0A2T0ZX96_9ACTN|nr:FAD binding domain-containing protein [Antricoccus suffuscus]PRZ40982.1 carbon-monoxide dehydrogenase medium subunit [Antricoccus suffuscus]